MILVQLAGGLGNQMFQYATGRHLAAIHDTSLMVDLSLLNQDFDHVTKRGYELGAFNLDFNSMSTVKEFTFFNGYADPTFLQRLSFKLQRIIKPRRIYREKHFHYDSQVLSLPDNTCLQGFWQSHRYFDDITTQLREEFQLLEGPSDSCKALWSKITSTTSVCLHVRRGDYVSRDKTAQSHGFLGPDYYHRSLDQLRSRVEEAEVFVFSDDIQWCKEHLQIAGPVHFVDQDFPGANTHQHLFLMTSCKHYIIANSTFSWWGAWLNPSDEKVVIAPRQWFAGRDVDDSDLIPENWLRL